MKVLADLDAGDEPIAAWQFARGILIAASRHGIDWWDFRRPSPVSRPVTMTIVDDTPFIGAYERVTVDLGTTGFAMEDLAFTLPDADAAGANLALA